MSAANGNDVTLTVNEGAVKDAAVSAVTVSTDAATDTPVTITPTTGTKTDKLRQGRARFHDEAVHGSMDNRQGHKARQIVQNVCPCLF